MAVPRSWATDAADVLAFEVVEVVDVGRARRGRLHYFLTDQQFVDSAAGTQ